MHERINLVPYHLDHCHQYQKTNLTFTSHQRIIHKLIILQGVNCSHPGHDSHPYTIKDHRITTVYSDITLYKYDTYAGNVQGMPNQSDSWPQERHQTVPQTHWILIHH